MRPGALERHRRLLVALVCLLLAACGGKGSDGGSVVTPPPPPLPVFQCGDSPAMVDHVALKCGARLGANVWQIDVVIGSPTTSTDIDGFAFDLLFDPSMLAYVPDSARAGSMLSQDGNLPLLSVQIPPGDPGRLVVGVYRSGEVAGVQGLPGYDQIMMFSMKVVSGAQFDADPRQLRFDADKFQALDSSAPRPQPIPSITFSDQLLLSYQ